jgi:hypothetical protein
MAQDVSICQALRLYAVARKGDVCKQLNYSTKSQVCELRGHQPTDVYLTMFADHKGIRTPLHMTFEINSCDKHSHITGKFPAQLNIGENKLCNTDVQRYINHLNELTDPGNPPTCKNRYTGLIGSEYITAETGDKYIQLCKKNGC